MNSQIWKKQNRFLQLENQWLTLIGEHLQDTQGDQLEYWRVEKADSIIIIPIQNQQLILPPPTYRPGVHQVTLDFPSGRWTKEESLEQTAIKILQRELRIAVTETVNLTLLNSAGWDINSSFSNQKLYGFVAQIEDYILIPSEYMGETYPISKVGIQALLSRLNCLQCRAILLEWWTTI
jgi:hypothetical protein